MVGNREAYVEIYLLFSIMSRKHSETDGKLGFTWPYSEIRANLVGHFLAPDRVLECASNCRGVVLVLPMNRKGQQKIYSVFPGWVPGSFWGLGFGKKGSKIPEVGDSEVLKVAVVLLRRMYFFT